MAHFYKYVTAETGMIILNNRTLRWSTPPILNDPFDMQFAFQLRVDRQVVRAMALEKYWHHHFGPLEDRPINQLGRMVRRFRGQLRPMTREDFNQTFIGAIDEGMENAFQDMERHSKMIRDHFANDKILCLSESPESILMWSYYANNHSGIVLRFTDQTDDNPLSMARRVGYVDQVPSLFDNHQLSDMLAGYEGRSAEQIIAEVVWTKSNVWAHEREWRVYTGQGRTDGQFEDVPFGAGELDGIIFGIRTPEQHRRAATEVIRRQYPHVQLLHAKARPDAYAISIEQSE